MPERRAYKDRPFRRVGVAALIAVGVHAVALGAGAYLFRDYVFSDPSKPRLTQEQFERAVADVPILSQSNIIAAGPDFASDETEPVTPDWSETRMSLPAWSWWSWETDPRLSTSLAVPERK